MGDAWGVDVELHASLTLAIVGGEVNNKENGYCIICIASWYAPVLCPLYNAICLTD
jgi:hypothetical protein